LFSEKEFAMTINTMISRIAYRGDGITRNFAIPFVFFDADEIEVIERDTISAREIRKVLGADYAVAGGNGAIGTLTSNQPPAVGVTITVRRNTARTQLVDYTPNDPFPAETHERALDRLTVITQELAEILGRSLTLPVSSPLSGITIPEPGASKFWRWNATGTAIEVADIGSLGAVGLPLSINQGGTGAITAIDALDNLEAVGIHIYQQQSFL